MVADPRTTLIGVECLKGIMMDYLRSVMKPEWNVFIRKAAMLNLATEHIERH